MTHLDTPQSICSAGMGRRDITPPVGIYHRMWGAATEHRAQGVHRPLLATALALGPAPEAGHPAGDSRHVLLAIDHCLLWNPELARLAEQVCAAARLDRSQLHVACSHTHAAGLMDRSRSQLPGGEMIAGYLDELAARAAESVCEALSNMQAASIVYGQGRCDLAGNRDFWDPHSEQFVCGWNPEGVADDTLLVARLSDSSGRVIGTVVNYACHPTTLAWENSQISPDYVGATREVVERACGGLCLFLQGASGDLGPREGFVGDVGVADRNGRQLGFSALAVLESLPPAGTRFEYAGPVVSGATLGIWRHVPLSHAAVREKCRWNQVQFAVELQRRQDLPTASQTRALHERWRAAEQQASAEGDVARARDAGAHAERMARQLTRLESMPEGAAIPVAASLLRIGDGVWLTLAGEHYQRLQRMLRRRFADHRLIVATVTDGWLPGYVPTEETFGRGIYQESIAVVAPGALELLIDALSARIDEFLAKPGRGG